MVSGLVSQSTFDTKMNEISQEFSHKFDMPYYYEYNGDTDFEDTSETTLAMFNEIKELMEAGQKPCIIVKKGATGANSYITYHFIVPQFGSLDTTYIMLKGSPVRKEGSTFNLVALNCEKDPETNQIKRVYEKKADGSIEIGGTSIYEWNGTLNDTSKLIFKEAIKSAYDETLQSTKIYYKGHEILPPSLWKQVGVAFFASSIVANGNFLENNYVTFSLNYDLNTYEPTTFFNPPRISKTQIYDYTQREIPAQLYRSGMGTNGRRTSALGVNNTATYTPTGDYNPATKKYVDDAVASAGGGDGVFKITLTANQTAGYDANKTIDEIQAAISANKTVIAVVDSDEYPLKYHTETELRFTSIELNRSVLVLYSDGVWTMQDTNMLKTSGGNVNGNINMNSNAITNIQKLHVDGEAPVYIGSTIETGVTNASRITGIAGGGVAIVRANTQGTYDPLFIADPTNINHAATKNYVDNKLASIQGYDATKTQTLKNINGVLTWQTDGE